MAQYSYFWLDDAVGHGTLQPYDFDVIDEIIKMLAQHAPTSQGVLPGYLDELTYSNPAGSTARISDGGAIVSGSLYFNSADVDFDLSVGGDGYYTIVLRKGWAAQTVRLALLGPNGVAYPTPTQTDGVTWELPIWYVRRNGGTIVEVLDARDFIRNEYGEFKLIGRIGDPSSRDWDDNLLVSGNIIGSRQMSRAQAGCKNWSGGAATSGSTTITFPIAFSDVPIAIVTPSNNHGNVNVVVATTTSQLTIYWKSGDATTYSSLDFQWLAMGNIERGE